MYSSLTKISGLIRYGKIAKNVFGNSLEYINSTRCLSIGLPQLNKAADIEVTFVRASGERIKAKGKEGDSLLDVVVNNNLDLDGFGACEGTLTCSTCHLIFKKADYDKLPDKPGDEELDMLDLAYELTDTSRLGCQINLTKDMNGLEVNVPATVNDARET
ncbi:adrenodoxin-like protein 2, mitochondrial [Condylostylus longicornis]|uniref:adrenodoxin-like protein 2, mitochondrial n=1 Tax=Condylostylus longicornis TaxID=2530218 RepID=UPI00244DB9FF|nr:adrenodoxin-like protein 2, mitochondrial [Condylostylus longicornis]